MKFIVLILFFSILFLSCQTIEKANSEKKEIPTSRILNEELKETIPQLIQLRKQTGKGFDRGHYSDSNPYIHLTTTKEFVYIHISIMDCISTPFYQFVDNFGETEYSVLVDANSFEPERYLNLKELIVVPREFDDVMFCHDWYWLKVKYKRAGSKLKLEKISTFFDNSYEETFYDKSDSTFLYKQGILIAEPGPEPPLRSTE